MQIKSGERRDLVVQCQHRIDRQRDLLSDAELNLLTDVTNLLQRGKNINEGQYRKVFAILERTASQRAPKPKQNGPAPKPKPKAAPAAAPAGVEWSQEYASNIKVLDEDHKQLFALVGQLKQFVGKEVEPGRMTGAINGLSMYVDEHFVREERYMQSAGYPEFEAHKLEHEKLAQMIGGLSQLNERSPEKIDPAKVFAFLQDWLKNHILKIDMHYVPYLTGEKQGVREAPDSRAPVGQPLRPIQIEIPPDAEGVTRSYCEILARGGESADGLLAVVADYIKRDADRVFLNAVKVFGK